MKTAALALVALALVGSALAQAPAAAPSAAQTNLLFTPTTDSDFQSALQVRSQFAPDTFVYKFGTVDAQTPGGNLRGLFINTDSSLIGNNVAQNLVTVEACACNQPHNHPRGTEISHITEGQLMFGFVEENGGRVILANLTRGQSVFIPQGLMHFAQNLGCARGQFLATFPSVDPGTQTYFSNFMRLPDVTIAATTGLSVDQIHSIRTTASTMVNPSRGDPACLARCGITADYQGSPMASDIYPASGAPVAASAPAGASAAATTTAAAPAGATAGATAAAPAAAPRAAFGGRRM